MRIQVLSEDVMMVAIRVDTNSKRLYDQYQQHEMKHRKEQKERGEHEEGTA